MKTRFFRISDGMLWATLPLLMGLFYWEHSLRIIASGHKLVQILLLLVIFAWVNFWNIQVEYDHRRHSFNDRTQKVRYRLVASASSDEREWLIYDPSVHPECSNGVTDDQANGIHFQKDKDTIEVKHHVSNN